MTIQSVLFDLRNELSMRLKCNYSVTQSKCPYCVFIDGLEILALGIRYQVLENERPCSVTGCPSLTKGVGWDRHSFNSFEEALAYTKKWLGDYAVTIPENWDGSSYDYSGYGDIIEIREVFEE